MARKKKNAGSVPLTSPQTREEHYLANIAGLVGTKPEYPFTRTERYLDAISGSTSGLDDRVTALEIGKLDVIGKGINLIDNSHFTVNQRYPQTQWNGGAYTIDRWRTWVPEQVTSITASGFEVTVPIDASDLGSICQYFDTFPIPVGQPVTFSVLASDGDLVTETGTYNGTGFEMRKLASWGQIYAFDTGSGVYQKGVIIIVNKGVTKTFVATKLELGTQQTLARKIGDNWVLNDPPPNYQQELAKCQRYLQVFEGDVYAYLGSTYATSSTSVEPIIPLLVSMNKKTGSILASTTAFLQTNGAWNQQVTIPAGNDNVRISPNTAAFTISLESGILGTFPSIGAISSDGYTKIIISTE